MKELIKKNLNLERKKIYAYEGGQNYPDKYVGMGIYEWCGSTCGYAEWVSCEAGSQTDCDRGYAYLDCCEPV